MTQINKGMKTYSLKIGEVYGLWKTLEKGPPQSCKTLCLCLACYKTQKLVRNRSLIDGISKSCGCRREKIEIGKLYGSWLVLELQGRKSLCKCTGCNQVERAVLNRNLKIGRSISCGCLKSVKTKQTNFEKYGTEYYTQSQDRKDKAKLILQKQKKTSLERYGVEIYSQTDEGRKQISESKQKRTPEEEEKTTLKRKRTLQKRYGVTATLQLEEFQQKRLKTTIERHGTANPLAYWRRTNKEHSKGEQLISSILKEHGIKFEHEYSFEDCMNIMPLTYDFYLSDHNVLIEYDGKHHFMPVCFGGISQDEAENNFLKTQVRDRIKTKYAANHSSLILVRIDYTEDVRKRMNALIDFCVNRRNK